MMRPLLRAANAANREFKSSCIAKHVAYRCRINNPSLWRTPRSSDPPQLNRMTH